MKPRKGIALISAVIMMGLLLILLGAFLQVNRGHLWLLNATEERNTALSACQAAYDYMVYRLEHNKLWGATGQPWGADDPLSNDELSATEVNLPGVRRVKGFIPKMEATFTVELENNLMGAAASGTVPPGCARLRITGYARDGASREIKCLVHVAPLYDSSAVAQGSINIHSDKFYVRSKDPWRNQVRAKKDVLMPEVVTRADTQFLKPDSTEKDPMGLMWSQQQIKSKDSGALTSSNLAAANANAGGKFVPGAGQHFEIYDLGSESVQKPATETNMSAGKYCFAKATAKVTVNVQYDAQVGDAWAPETKSNVKPQVYENQEIQVLEWYANPTDTVPTKVWRSGDRTDDLPIPPTNDVAYPASGWRGPYTAHATGGIVPGSAQITGLEITYPHGNPGQVIIGDIATLDDGNKVKADLYSQQVTIEDETNVVVGGGTAGGLTINSERGGQPPVLKLGSTGKRAAIKAKDTVDLSNVVTDGVGTLVSESGDVNIVPLGQNFEVDSTNPSFGGLVLYAGKNVNVKNPDSGGKWDFKGLVYAKNNFNFDANGANATVEGAVVAHDGDINFNQAKQVDFIYNPAYLSAMVKALPNNRLKLERLQWRE